jgi:uncharacterized protein YodC (DUF2158 family)
MTIRYVTVNRDGREHPELLSTEREAELPILDSSCSCQWHDTYGVLHSAEFQSDMLDG